jgi:hypothetical protein
MYRSHNCYMSREEGEGGPYDWLIIALTQCIHTSTQLQLRLPTTWACAALPTIQLYVFYVLRQQVHFKSHVTREDNLWHRASSAATQRLACYTRWRQCAVSISETCKACVCVCVCKESPLTSSNGSNQFLITKTKQLRFCRPLRPLFGRPTSFGMQQWGSVLRRFGGTCCCRNMHLNQIRLPWKFSRDLFPKGRDATVCTNAEECHHFGQHVDRARCSHGTHKQTAKKVSSGTYSNQCDLPVNTISIKSPFYSLNRQKSQSKAMNRQT